MMLGTKLEGLPIPAFAANQLMGMAQNMFGTYIEGTDPDVIAHDLGQLEEILHFVRTGEGA